MPEGSKYTAQQYVYTNATIQSRIDVIGKWLLKQPFGPRRLTRKTRGREERAFSHAVITQAAVAHWARRITAGETTSLDALRSYATFYADALMLQPSARHLIYLNAEERPIFEAHLSTIHKALAKYRKDIPALLTRSRGKTPNDVLIVIMAIIKLADDIENHPDRLTD